MKMKKIYKKAFTLAEILVILMILGVVFAALAPTINTFNQERADKIFKAKTGKAYSILSEALRARFVADQQRMAGNSAASNLLEYITDGTAGALKTINRIDSGFKTQDGMVFAVSGSSCHMEACFVIVDMDGQDKGKTRLSLDAMAGSLSEYGDATLEEAKDPDDGHNDIAVFMVKDGQVYPYTAYTADNMQMERNQDESFQTREVNLRFRELNLGQD